MFGKIKTTFVLAAVLIVFFTGYFLFSLLMPAGAEGKVVYFKINSGENLKQITQNLKDQGLIRDRFVFQSYVKFIGAEKNILAGEHQLKAKMNIIALTFALKNPANIGNEAVITIIEGWQISEIAGYLAAQNLATQKDFLTAAKTKNWQGKYDFLNGVTADNLEGFLFPDTYRIFIRSKPEEIIKKMLDNFDRKLTEEMRQEIKGQKKNVFEVVILASIVEREARTEEDMRLVADVFLKRLSANIGLQSDATINYISGRHDLRPKADSLNIDSPYNTYKYRGLPPGPIGNPGLTAIKAVIYPKKNDYYYFLMDKDGETHYAKTFSEHQKNIRKFLE